MSLRPGRAGGGRAAAAPGRGGFGPGPSSGATSPAEIGAGPAPVQAVWGALGWAKLWLSNRFWVWAGGLGTKEPDAEGGHPGPPPLPRLRTPGSAKHAFLTSDPNHPAQLRPHTFQFVCFNWGLPILEAGKLRLHQEGGERGADPSSSAPFCVQSLSEERSKGPENRGQKEQATRNRLSQLAPPAPGEWAGRELPGEAQVSGEAKVPRVQHLLS